MIKSSEEFIKLSYSNKHIDIHNSRREEISEELWLEILDKYPRSIGSVALNKKLPDSIIWKLIREGDSRIRRIVSQKHKLTHEMFEHLARDEDEGIRVNICYNKKVPRSILEFLENDPSPFVAQNAKKCLLA